MISPLRKILVFGGAGYLGSVLSEALDTQGYEVTIYDQLRFGKEPIADLVDGERCRLIDGDIRDAGAVARAVKEHDAVILLAALVGEPACDKDPEETVSINVMGSLNVLEACRYYGTRRFIFASTDSCYGIQEGIINELNPMKPISLYGRAKVLMEDRIQTAWQEDRNKPSIINGQPPAFGPIILRMATLYGLSRRMRLDLVLNILSWRAATGQTISIYGGDQWRPLVHVKDAAQAYISALEAPPEMVLGQVFNVGSNDQNVQIKDVGHLVAREFPEVKMEHIEQLPDLRDYHVDFSKIERTLGWKAQRTIQQGVREIKEAVEAGKFGGEILPQHRNA
jgi:nucleoside-diphosphate-sugar epimerase